MPVSDYKASHGNARRKRCVYTCLIGGYERLNEQEASASSHVEFICFTDDQKLQSKTWNIHYTACLFEADPIRSQRAIKILAHEYLGEYEESLYIDNSVVLKKAPEELFEKWLPEDKDFALSGHSFRSSVLDEFLEVSKLGFDDQGRIFEQLNHYSLYTGDVLSETPYWTAILLRRHHVPWIKEMARIWFSHVMRYSRRDQLSVNYAFKRAGVIPHLLRLDNLESEFHQWPSSAGRDRQRGVRDVAASLMPPVALARLLLEKNQRLEDEIAALKKIRDDLVTTNQTLKVELSSKEKQAMVAARKLESARQRLATSKFKLEERTRSRDVMMQSASWRITKSLRRFAAWVSRNPRFHKPGDVKQSSALVVVCENGRVIYANPCDRRAVELVKAGGSLNPTSLVIWQQLIHGRVWTDIVDVGANYGEMLLNVDLPKGAAVTVAEPNPNVLPFLKKSLSEARIQALVTGKAVSSSNGTARLMVDHTWSGMSSLDAGVPLPADHSVLPYEVSVTTLDALLSTGDTSPRARSFLIKLDVEGHELEVLEGAKVTLAGSAAFAVQVEILHLSEEKLRLLLNSFDLLIFDKKKRVFLPLVVSKDEPVKAVFGTGEFYNQDAVLIRKGSDFQVYQSISKRS